MKLTTISLAAAICLCLTAFGILMAQQDDRPSFDEKPRLTQPDAPDPPGSVREPDAQEPSIRVPVDRAEDSLDPPRRNEQPALDPTGTPRLVTPGPKAPSEDALRPPIIRYRGGSPQPPAATVAPMNIANTLLKEVRKVRQVIEHSYRSYTPDELRERQQLLQLRAQLKSGRGDQRERASQQLEELLGEMFDRDMKERQRMLSELEQKLTKLRRGYDARKQARNRIVKHQLEGMEMEAQGLEFPSEGTRPSGPTAVPGANVPFHQHRGTRTTPVPVPGVQPAPGVLQPSRPAPDVLRPANPRFVPLPAPQERPRYIPAPDENDELRALPAPSGKPPARPRTPRSEPLTT